MNVLAIGNSFSQDATRYLHRIARSAGEKLTVVNLYIGGCPLSRHYRNMLSKERAYEMSFNGQPTGFFVSIEEALLSRDWDYVTLQQASRSSVDYTTYQPYLDDLSSFVRMCCPKCKLLIHETWEYEKESTLLAGLGYTDPKDMYDALHAAYDFAAHAISADDIIPSGTLLRKLVEKGFKVHRDGFHASFGLGRYALGLLWYAKLFGNEIDENTFDDFDEPVSEEDVKTVKSCVKSVL